MKTIPMAGATRECPECTRPLPEAARICEHCGADLSKYAGSTADALSTRGVGTLASENRGAPATPSLKAGNPPDPESSDSAEERVQSFLYLCPSCGAFVRAEDTSCASCGASLGEAQPPATVPEAEGGPGDDAARAAADEAPELPPAESAAEAIARDETLPDLEKTVVERGREELAVEFAADEPAPPELDTETPGPPQGEAKERVAKLPTTGRRVVPRGLPTSLASWREYMAIVSGLAAPTAAAIAASATGQAWGQLFPFGILFGMSLLCIVLNLAVPEVRRETRNPLFVLWIVGTTLALAVPLAALLGLPRSPLVGLALLGAGIGLGLLAAWRLPRGVGMVLPELSGLLLLMVAAVAPLASVSLGDPAVTTALWVAGSGLAIGPAILILYRRRMVSLAARRLESAEEALSKREYTKALGLYEETLLLAARAGQDLGAALYGKGAALVAVGRPDDALEVLDRALSSSAGNEVAWVNKGTALTRMGRLQDALKCYNSAIRVNAAYEVAWNNKGNALSRLGKDEWALKCYEHALTLDPSYRTAWVNKGYVLAKLGRFDEAAECADRAIRLTASAGA